MPKQKRWTIKRELEQADGHIHLAIDQLAITGHQYADVHDDYYQAFIAIVILLDMAEKELMKLKDRI